MPGEIAEFADLLFNRICGNIKLIYRIHGKSKHQQRIAVALVIKEFMWIIWYHC